LCLGGQFYFQVVCIVVINNQINVEVGDSIERKFIVILSIVIEHKLAFGIERQVQFNHHSQLGCHRPLGPLVGTVVWGRSGTVVREHSYIVVWGHFDIVA